jgi:hypothetical protein
VAVRRAATRKTGRYGAAFSPIDHDAAIEVGLHPAPPIEHLQIGCPTNRRKRGGVYPRRSGNHASVTEGGIAVFADIDENDEMG